MGPKQNGGGGGNRGGSGNNKSSSTTTPSGQTTTPSGQTTTPSGQTTTPSGQTTTPPPSNSVTTTTTAAPSSGTTTTTTTRRPHSRNVININSLKQVNKIVNAENARLNEKDQTYQNLQFGEKRMLDLNTNFQKRTAAFNWILLCLFVVLASMVFLLFLNKKIPGIDTIITLLLIIIGGIGGCYIFYLYVVFMNRNPMNYDEIQYDVMSKEASVLPVTTPSSTLSPNNSTTPPPCSGESCCDEGTVWDSTNQVCVPSSSQDAPSQEDNAPQEGFITTRSTIYFPNANDGDSKKSINPFQSSSFSTFYSQYSSSLPFLS
jgi:hypothetical protein